MWTCPRCSEDVEDSFEVCWNCGTTRSGEIDPEFLTAEEMPVIPNSPETVGNEPILAGPSKSLDHLERDDDFQGDHSTDLVECYWARDELEARFLAEGLMESGIPAIADTDLMRAGLGAAAFGVPYFSPRVRVRPEDLEKAKRWLADHDALRRKRPASDDDPSNGEP